MARVGLLEPDKKPFTWLIQLQVPGPPYKSRSACTSGARTVEALRRGHAHRKVIKTLLPARDLSIKCWREYGQGHVLLE